MPDTQPIPESFVALLKAANPETQRAIYNWIATTRSNIDIVVAILEVINPT